MQEVSAIDFAGMEHFIRNKLKNELSGNLYYHGIHHTDDVYNAACHLAELESVDEKGLLLLKTAVLYHDSGFTVIGKGHEQIGCEIAEASLPDFGYSADSIEIICGMIRATKIPQSPQNHLEEIICDADLDYLGRDDYDPISSTLYHEISPDGAMSREQWLSIQVTFLEQHLFFTATAIRLRKQKKDARLQLLKEELARIK